MASSPSFPILIIPSNQVSSLRRKQLEDEFRVIEGSPLIWDLVAPSTDVSAEGSIEHRILKLRKPICILTDTSQKIAEAKAEQLIEEEDAIALCNDIDDFILPPYMRRGKALEEKKGNEVEDTPQKGEESHLPRGTRTGPKRCLGGQRFEYHRKYHDNIQAMMKFRNRLKIEESLEGINYESGKRKRSYGQRGRGRRGGGHAYHSKTRNRE